MPTIDSEILEDHSTEDRRAGEGAAVVLEGGDLYLVYGQFDGGADHAPARLVSRRSADGGASWSEPEVFFVPEPGWVNAMSVSLLRLADGRIGCVFLAKTDEQTCVPYWCVSDDEAQSWSDPGCMIHNGGYYVVNNDRLVQLDDGRLLVPYAFSMTLGDVHQPRCGCLVSDDGGATWRHGGEEIDLKPENYREPELVVEDRLPALRRLTYGLVRVQEPGVVELTDGRVLMWARSNGGYAYATYSEDRGESWSEFRPLCSTPMANGPATIKRLPGTGRLIMLHNDRTGVPYGDRTFMWRTPLAVSVSDDESESWQPHDPLIGDDSYNYCYYSICFFGDRSLVTTYQSANRVNEQGLELRSNLRSLRVLRVDRDWW